MTEPFTTTLSANNWVALAVGAVALFGVIWSNINTQRSLSLSRSQRIAEFRMRWLDEIRSDIADFLSFDTQLEIFAINRKTISELKFNVDCDPEILKRIGSVVDADALELSGTVKQKINRFESLNLRLSQEIENQRTLLDSLAKLMSDKATLGPEISAAIHKEIISKSLLLVKSEREKILNRI